MNKTTMDRRISSKRNNKKELLILLDQVNSQHRDLKTKLRELSSGLIATRNREELINSYKNSILKLQNQRDKIKHHLHTLKEIAGISCSQAYAKAYIRATEELLTKEQLIEINLMTEFLLK